MKIKVGDNVVIIAGKDKGKTGEVLRVMKKTGRIVVKEVNMRKRHIKKTAQRAGEIITYEASIDASNAMLIDPKTKKRTRVGYKVMDNGKPLRIAKKSGEALDQKKTSKK